MPRHRRTRIASSVFPFSSRAKGERSEGAGKQWAAPAGRKAEREEAVSILQGSNPLRGWCRRLGAAVRRREETPSAGPPAVRSRSPPLRWSLAAAADCGDEFEADRAHLPPARAHHIITVRVEAADR